MTRPRHVAAVLWLEGQAELLGLDLVIEAADMVSAELLAFSGLETAVQVAPAMPGAQSSPAAV